MKEITPKIRLEYFLEAIANAMNSEESEEGAEVLVPETRIEYFLNKIAENFKAANAPAETNDSELDGAQ